MGYMILLGIIIAVLIGCIVRGVLISKRFDRLSPNMEYREVLSIVGQPKSTTRAKDIATCLWQYRILRDWRVTWVVVFKDDKVLTITRE